VGEADEPAYSFDGISWKRMSTTNPPFGWSSIYAIAWGNGKFVACGQDGKGVYGSFPNITARLVFNEDGTVGWARG
jgi:hypothetical protein